KRLEAVMRTKLAILVILLFCTQVSIAQTKTAREEHGLIGPVRSVRTETAKAPNPFGKLMDASRASIIIISYDEKGNITEGSSFYPNGTLKRRSGWTYTYDASGKVKERG